MVSGGITPFMHPETMTATIEVRVVEGMTKQRVPNELRSALAKAGLAGRVEIALAGPPHDWVPPSSAAGATRLIGAAATALRSVLGAEPPHGLLLGPPHGVLLGVTDSCWLTEAGIPTLPAFGCGSLAVAHRPDERIPAAIVSRVTSWADHAIWWHVYPLGFTGAEKAEPPAGEPVRHRLRQLAGWLDYAVELGCSGLLLGPVFAAETHGYDTIDHFQIDPRLGDQEDFDYLIAQAGRRGLRVVLDGVFNHVGRSFPAFQAALRGGPGSPAARWFRRDPASGDFTTFEGHRQLVALDHKEPEVLNYVTQVMTHWLDRGAAGWRLDAAYAVPAGFWAKALPAVRGSHPDAWFLGEMIHGDYVSYAAESGLDSITQYELWKAIWSSLNDRNFFELGWALGRHDEILDGVMPQTFTGNHDVTRLASRIADARHLGHALAVLMTVGGIPSIYYGDEQAFRGVKEERADGDDEIRPAFPARPDGLPPGGWPAYRLHQRLIGFRRRHPWLVRARTTVPHLASQTMAFRAAAGDAEVLVLLNTGDEAFRFPVDITGFSVTETPDPGARPADPALVPAHSWAILGS